MGSDCGTEVADVAWARMLPPTDSTARAPARGFSSEPAELVHHDRSAGATVRVRGHGRRDRARRALVALAGCWGAAIAAVFLPVLHFVLVPALLVAGPLAAWSQLRERLTILDVEGPCPACGAAIREAVGSDARTPIALRCGGCRRALSVRLPRHLLEA